MDIPNARFTKRLGQGSTGTIYRMGEKHAVKVLSHDYIREQLLPKADSPKKLTAMCYRQLTWEDEIASGLRKAGVKSVVHTYGVHEVVLRWFDTRMRASSRLALVMDYVPGIPVTELDEIVEPVARWHLGVELQNARHAGFIPDEEAEDPAQNALYDDRTSRLTLIDFSHWADVNPYRPTNGKKQSHTEL